MSSNSGAGETVTSPPELQGIAPEATTMEAKLMVATASGDVQQLKDKVMTEESQMMVVVMAKQKLTTAAAENPDPRHGKNMDPRLLALASSGSYVELQALLKGEHGHAASSNGSTTGSLPAKRPTSSSYGGDIEANESILKGVTAEGDTALHVVTTCGEGDNFFTRFRDLRHPLAQLDSSSSKDKRRCWRWGLTRAECRALTTYGDGYDFLESARIIYMKANHLLFVQNNNGDTPLHCAARAGKSNMVACLVDLAFDEGGVGRMKELLRTENKGNETALHEAVRIGNAKIVGLLMDKDPELASFPAQGGGASPIREYMLQQDQDLIRDILAERSEGKFSISGQNGQNILHAAVLRAQDLTKFFEWIEPYIGRQNKDLTTQRDKNGSTPLHFAAARPSRICQQVFKSNPDALYQADNAGFFPIHVAASVGASWNVDMFVTECPGSAGLRDAKGRTFLHVAVEEKVVNVISSACRNLSISWIMNIVDNDGSTALHLAVEAGSLHMFCPLFGNPRVKLNLPNNKGETPLDTADYRIPQGMFFYQNSEAEICRALRIAGAVKGVGRHDHLLEDNRTLKVNSSDESKESEVLKDSTAAMGIGSVLITTVTFGTTFAVPGGYIADDHDNGGSPVLARRYSFDAFIASNTLAFIFSAMATIGLMFAGTPLVNPWSRKIHLNTAFYFLNISLTSLVAAFGFGAYVVLAPVSPNTAVVIYVLSLLVPLYPMVEFIGKRLLLLSPLRTRKGLYCALGYSVFCVMVNLVFNYWALFLILDWAWYANQAQKIHAHAPAPAPAPAPLAA